MTRAMGSATSLEEPAAPVGGVASIAAANARIAPKIFIVEV
jgi:hypothetical protein